MVGFVIVSHSRALAESIVEFTRVMADGVPVRAAGGLEDGSFGTSFDRIMEAVEDIYTEDGVLILMDMGSAVMTAEMVIEALGDKKVQMADCPVVEGAVAGTISAAGGMDMEALLEELETVGNIKKI